MHDKSIVRPFSGRAERSPQRAGLLLGADDPGQCLFDLQMRDHFAANFGKPALAIDDGDKAFGIDSGDVARLVPNRRGSPEPSNPACPGILA